MGPRLGIALVVVVVLGCRKRAEQHTPIAPAEKIVDAATDVATETLDVATPPDARPAPSPPKLACTTDPRVRWRVSTEPEEITQHAGPEGFACSPFTVGKSPLELDMAPGTILVLSMEAEVSDGSDGGAFDTVIDAAHIAAGLPKGAWIDPLERALKWKVAGADGDDVAFSVGAVATLAEGKRCVTASIVVHVRDDDGTRNAQATWLNRETSAGYALGAAGMPGSPAVLELARQAKCGSGMVTPLFEDADGDGLKDAVFAYPPRGGGYPPVGDVWLRRGNTFAKVGQATGRPERAADGTTFFVDTASAGTGYACVLGVKIFQVFKNRVQLVVDESSHAQVDPSSTSCASGDGITLDHAAGAFVGFTDQGTVGTTAKRRVWRWDGKRFARLP